MPPTSTVLLLLLLFPAGVYSPDPSLSSPSGPWWCSQQLEDIGRRGAAQVLPGLLSRRVPQPHISVELVNQQVHHVPVAVDGSNVERRVATCWPAICVEGQTSLLNSIPETPARESRSVPGRINYLQIHLPLMSLKINDFHKLTPEHFDGIGTSQNQFSAAQWK